MNIFFAVGSRLFALASLILISTAANPASAQVPPQIVAHCAQEWPVDYEMQLFCQNKQVKAYQTLQEREHVSTIIANAPPGAFDRKNMCQAGEHNERKLWECGPHLTAETERLNGVYKKVRKPLSTKRKAELLSLQRAWIFNRNVTCRVGDWIEEVESVYAADVIECLTTQTKLRTQALRALE